MVNRSGDVERPVLIEREGLREEILRNKQEASQSEKHMIKIIMIIWAETYRERLEKLNRWSNRLEMIESNFAFNKSRLLGLSMLD